MRSSWLLLWCVAISSYSVFVNVGLVLCGCSCSLFFFLIIMICYWSVPLDFYVLLILVFVIGSSWLLLWRVAISPYSLFVNVGRVLCFVRVFLVLHFDYYELLLVCALGLIFVTDIILCYWYVI